MDLLKTTTEYLLINCGIFDSLLKPMILLNALLNEYNEKVPHN